MSLDEAGSGNSHQVKTVRVKFTWRPLTKLTFRSATLLSYQTIELLQDYDGDCYASNSVDFPVGEFDGQIVIGTSFCYTVKKFAVENEGGVVILELDVSKMDTTCSCGQPHNHIVYHGGSGSSYEGSSGTDDIQVHYNPAYRTQEYNTTGTLYNTTSNDGGGSRVLATLYYYKPDPSYDALPYSHDITSTQDLPKLEDTTSDSEHEETITGDDFSEQLSAEGFVPAKVKSKVTSTSSHTHHHHHHHHGDHTHNHHAHRQSQASHTNTQDATKTSARTSGIPSGKRTVGSRTAGTRTSSNATIFTPPSIKEVDNSADYDAVVVERDRLKANLERVSAQWTSRVKKLEERIKKYEEGRDPSEVHSVEEDHLTELEETIEDLRRELQDKDSLLDSKERELVESKDRITALENQLVEYAGTIQDQSKLIQGSVGPDSVYSQQITKLKQLYEKSIEFTKKQQIEFQEKVSYFQTQLNNMPQLQEENNVLREVTKKLSGEIEEHRAQTRQLLKDIEKKGNQVERLRDKLYNMERSSESDMESMELEALRQKCEGWKETAERSEDELEALKQQMEEIESQRDGLLQELQATQDKLQVALGEKESLQTKLSDVTARQQELQSIRLQHEQELGTLRSERTQTLERNAQLVEACDPEKNLKLKKEIQWLDSKRRELESELESTKKTFAIYQTHNFELKKQLDAASNPETLKQIEQKITKYKTEKEATKELMKQMKLNHEEELRKLQNQRMPSSEMQALLLERDEEIKVLRQKIDSYKTKRAQYREHIQALEEQIKSQEEFTQPYSVYSSKGDHYYNDADQLDGDSVGVHTLPKVRSGHHATMAAVTAVGSNYSLPSPTRQHKLQQEGVNLERRTSEPQLILPSGNGRRRSSSKTEGSSSLSRRQRPSSGRADQLAEQVVPVQTSEGERSMCIVRLERGAMQDGMTVVVKRSNGSFDRGVIKYIGGVSGNKEEFAGVVLDLPRTDSGKNNDGTYKDGVRYFTCAKGHGLFTPLSKLYYADPQYYH